MTSTVTNLTPDTQINVFHYTNKHISSVKGHLIRLLRYPDVLFLHLEQKSTLTKIEPTKTALNFPTGT